MNVTVVIGLGLGSEKPQIAGCGLTQALLFVIGLDACGLGFGSFALPVEALLPM